MTEDFTHPYADQAHLELRGKAGAWHWTLVHTNGNVIATAGETYTKAKHATQMGSKLFPRVPWGDPEGGEAS